jgi:hypothetical protein
VVGSLKGPLIFCKESGARIKKEDDELSLSAQFGRWESTHDCAGNGYSVVFYSRLLLRGPFSKEAAANQRCAGQCGLLLQYRACGTPAAAPGVHARPFAILAFETRFIRAPSGHREACRS